PFLFGATDKIDLIAEGITDLPPVIIVRLRNMNAIDTTGVQALEELTKKVHASGRQIIFCGMRDQPLKFMTTAGFPRVVGEKNL
ncbi:sodium-independent anion transporter, partial [Acinetobacter baumannii]